MQTGMQTGKATRQSRLSDFLPPTLKVNDRIFQRLGPVLVLPSPYVDPETGEEELVPSQPIWSVTYASWGYGDKGLYVRWNWSYEEDTWFTHPEVVASALVRMLELKLIREDKNEASAEN